MTTVDYVQDARERLLTAIGDALERPATDEQQAEILAAIDKLVVVAGNEAVVAKADAYVSVLRIIESENGRIAAVESKLRAAVAQTEERLAEIAACPRPVYHETHRYCPSCPWREDLDGAEEPTS